MLVTLTSMVQLAPAPTLPPVSSIEVPPALAVKVPPQVLEVTEGVVITTLAGRLSIKARLEAVSAEALLSMVKVRVLVLPARMASGTNTLANVGGGSIARSAVAGSATNKPARCRSLVTLGKVPAVALTGTNTSTSNVQVPPIGGSSPPLKARKPMPVISDEAPQGNAGKPVAIRPGMTAFKSSVNSMSLAVSAPGLVIVNVRVAVPVAVVGPSKDLLNVNSWMTSRVSLAGSPVTVLPSMSPVTPLVVLV